MEYGPDDSPNHATALRRYFEECNVSIPRPRSPASIHGSAAVHTGRV